MVEVDAHSIRQQMTDYFTKSDHLMRGLVDHQLKKREIRNRSNIDVLDALLNICPEEIDRSHIEQWLS